MVDEDLEPLITRCPNCSTQFRVTESQLAAASGRVRCGACLTVFEGTDHLILDEDSTFSDGVDADAALDALLDELGTAEKPPEPEVDSAESAEEEALTDDTPVIYGGFEDEPANEPVGEIVAEGSVEPVVESTAANERIESADGIESQEVAEPEQPLPEAQDLKSGPEGDTETAEADKYATVADAESGSVLDEDYKAWIRPGTPDIDQMVHEVVSSVAEAPQETEPDAADAGPANEDGFHLSAVEKALEEEGVGTRPISFAPEPRRWWVIGVAALLLLTLAGQIFFLQLPDWSRDPGTRGMYEAVCGLLGCQLPEIRALDALRTRNLMVRSHPELEDALVIDAVIVNQAGFAQRFPGLALRFTSVGGLLVAGRTFQPDEYLAGEIGPEDLMPVNTPVQVSLEISDPGEEAVNYTLSFR
jgi:predicted Zn finger-like uncharacterized protein